MAIESYLEEFVEVVERGSVSAAARALNVPRASVSRRLARLEESYGVTLLHRQTHRQSLTEAGRELYRRARRIAAQLEDARRAVSALDGVPRGVLRVGVPPEAGVEMALARAYRAAWPEVELEFVATHGALDMLGRGLDVALHGGPIDDESLIGRKLLRFRTVVCASPDLLARRGAPTVETLPEWPCLLGFDPAGRPVAAWPLWGGGTVAVSGPIRSTSMASRMEGARLGLGLALVSERSARRLIEQGALVPVLEDAVGAMTAATLIWPAAEFMDPKVRAFVDLATDVIGRMVQARDAAAEA